AAHGELALVMEYVDGVTLAALLRKVRAADDGVPIPIVAAIMGQILSGLHAAHETCDEDGRLLHIVHRDVSGQNVLVGRDGVVRVADFGVAVAAGDVTRDVKGKLGYMAPEQLSGQPIDRRADIWAAGVLLWEMIARRRLFGGELGDVIRRV